MVEQVFVEFPASWTKPESPGYGTYPGPYKFRDIARYAEAVRQAIIIGYRHIDTAQAYGNEVYIRGAIRAGGVPRDKIFLTSKLHIRGNSYWGALKGIVKSIIKLRTKPDMYLIHYPGAGRAIEAWKGLIKAKTLGLCRYIGVSNFEQHHLETLIEKTGVAPAVNQIEFHPHLWSERLAKLVDFCRENSIGVEGYSPLAQCREGLLQKPEVLEIATNHNTTPARVILKWCIQHGVRPIAGTLSEKHIVENFGPYDFTLSEREMIRIDALGEVQDRVSLNWGWDPTTAELR